MWHVRAPAHATKLSPLEPFATLPSGQDELQTFPMATVTSFTYHGAHQSTDVLCKGNSRMLLCDTALSMHCQSPLLRPELCPLNTAVGAGGADTDVALYQCRQPQSQKHGQNGLINALMQLASNQRITPRSLARDGCYTDEPARYSRISQYAM